MTIQLVADTKTEIDVLLEQLEEWDEEKDKRRYEALAKISTFPAKDQIEKYILNWLDTESHDNWQRAWALSALAQIGLPDGKERVLKHLLNPPEEFGWTRHFALINAANFDPFPMDQIVPIARDRDLLVRATALRLLIGAGVQKYETELLEMLRNQQNPTARWAAARALRNRTDLKMKRLSSNAEKRFIPALVDIAGNKNMPLDTRWECIQTLTFFGEKKIVATQLSELCMKDASATLRRYYLEALVKLAEANESRAALLKAVEDDDAQIRVEAAAALKALIGAGESIKQLVRLALTAEKNPDLLVDALRHIDREVAAKELQDALGSLDVRTSTRANDLLTLLGGQTATQILLGERTKALDRYTRILTGADYEVRQHFGQLIAQARAAFWISMAMHTVVFLIGVAALTGSLVLALWDGSNAIASWAAGTVGLATILLTTFYRNPLRNVRDSLNSLMQVDVVFLGYVRQINQIDATFKHMFLEAHDFGTKQMQTTVAEIQQTVNKILEEIKNYIENK